MEPTDALRSIETALRLVIRDVLGRSWMTATGAPDAERLNERQVEEAKRRDGAIVSNEPLDYTETYHLTSLVEKNWEKFQPVFKDKRRTLAFFGVIEDVRNSVAHSRDLVPFERELISGIAGQLRNQVSLYRSMTNESSKYYPLIENVKDNFGHEARSSVGGAVGMAQVVHSGRVEVGQTLTFNGNAYAAKGKPVKWLLQRQWGPYFHGTPGSYNSEEIGEGDSIVFDYTLEEGDVNERFGMVIIVTTDSKYHRYRDMPLSYDDFCAFQFAVNPPDE